MSLTNKTAEERFRDAFERLKEDRPLVLPRGSAVSQNNVAKEAGADPSALRKSRYPALIREIQAWVEINGSTKSIQVKRRAHRRKKDDHKAEIKRLESQRDHAQSQLASAHRQILELILENTQLQTRLYELLPPPTPLQGVTRH